ncbi:cytochrome c [Polyangium mundeleinium]|uniref:Cytochrome c n=1 Tax=Polyangium mundeleinium TaxID=2995306 RepID=A0ABT5EZP2_9BACT|nr:cytochrome c [Polyangium mundeleinium]MDC0746643.1 cytochrome c [Polyangium mundeleinium]
MRTALLGGLAMASAGCGEPSGGGEPVAGARAFPVEILGPPGTEVTVTLEVPAWLAARPALSLEVVADNVVAGEAAWVVVNDGAPIDLGASGLGIRRPFGGTGRGTIPLDAGVVKTGENRIAFRYARQVPDVSGFRVLGLLIRAPDDAGSRVELDLPWEDPATWTAPLTDPAAVEQGRAYFTAISRDGGPTCARCHADDGADLAVFAFSNHSIEARAEHHLFSPEEAAAIASYIRSLPVAPAGRVHDPPFQPGPGMRGEAGAGYDAVLADDAALGAALFPDGLPAEPAWETLASLDTSQLPSPASAPTWLRWLPRKIDSGWFTRAGGLLASTEAALADPGALSDALAFQSAAIQIGKELLIEEGDHQGRIELLRYAAVKLWAWQRAHGGYEGPDHGFPDGGPAFPYEVGFAFFEAGIAEAVPHAMAQALSWWVAQIAVNPGRGFSNGERPLNWRDVLRVAEDAGQGPSTLTFFHLLGSWEESRGALADDFGTAQGPVRLLAVPLLHVDAATCEALLRRFFLREAAFLAEGGSLSPNHHTLLANAWQSVCGELSAAQRQGLRAVAPVEIAPDLTACQENSP